MSSRLRLLAASTLLSALSGCGDPEFAGLFYGNVSSAPGPLSLKARSVTITRGNAIRADVTAVDDSGDGMRDLDLASSDESVFLVELATGSDRFVFAGVDEGEAELDVFISGTQVDSLPVTVLAPE